MYYLGDLIDEIESLSIAKNGSVAARLDDVEMAYHDYKRSKAYEKYVKKKKSKKQLEEFNRVSKIRNNAMKTAKKIIDVYDYDSEEYAERFMDKYDNSKDESFIDGLYLKYSQ